MFNLKGYDMNYAFITETLNEAGIKLFGYELLPPAVRMGLLTAPSLPVYPLDLYSNGLDFDMFLSIYCHKHRDIERECPNCPWSEIGGCVDTPQEEVIERFNNWRSTSEIVTVLEELNSVRSKLVLVIMNVYIDNSYDRPMLGYDEERGYHIDNLYYFGHEVLFVDSGDYPATKEGDTIHIPLDVIDIDDIVLPMPADTIKVIDC